MGTNTHTNNWINNFLARFVLCTREIMVRSENMENEKEGYTLKEKIFLIIGVVVMVVIPHLLFNHIAYGAELREPPSIEYAQAQHEVSKGDTLWLIAGWYKVDLEGLIHANPQIGNPNIIYPHERINIPNNVPSWNSNDNSGYENNW